MSLVMNDRKANLSWVESICLYEFNWYNTAQIMIMTFDNVASILGVLVSGFTAYHVYFLSKKISNRAKLEHKEKVKQQVENHIGRIHREGLNSEVYLVNINRYFKDYPSNKEKRFEGYSHLKAEIKATRFDGIEFFSTMPVQVYKKHDGKLSLKGEESDKFCVAFPVGVVPYEWIDYIDLEGDEYAYVPLFFCHYKARSNWNFWKRLLFLKFPYKRILYYKENKNYTEGDGPIDWKYSKIDID